MCSCGCGASCDAHCWNKSYWADEIPIVVVEDLQADEFDDDNENDGTEL